MKFDIDIKEMAVTEEEDCYTFQGVAFVYSQPANGFKFRPGAFTKGLENRPEGLGLPIFFNHNSNEVIGKWTSINDTKSKLVMSGELTKGVQKADEAFLLMKHGAITGLSVGGSLDEIEYKNKYTEVLEFGLMECSLTAIPANRKALIKKLSDSDNELALSEIEDVLRDALGLSRKSAKAWISKEKTSVTLSEEDKALALILNTFKN